MSRTRLVRRIYAARIVGLLFFLTAPTEVRTQPVLPPPQLPGLPALPPPVQARIHRFRYRGNTVFTDAELNAVVARFLLKAISADELEQARRALTLHYVQHGYINSGALLEDQAIDNGIVTFTLVEGRLSPIELRGHKRLRPAPLRRRIARHAEAPLNLHRLQEGLLMLREDPNIQRINAELKPGSAPGIGHLVVDLAESNPWQLGLELRNDRPPSVGAETIEAFASHSNVTGNGDRLEWRYGIAHGSFDDPAFSELHDWGASYSLPFTSRQTTIRFYYDESDYDIIAEPFSSLDVSSDSQSYGLMFEHPLHQSVHRKVVLGLSAGHRRSGTSLFGEPFSLSPGAVNGQSSVTALRFSQEWIERNQTRVLALRSTFSLGIDLLSSTDNGTDRDGTFISWLGQAQYIRRLGRTPAQVVLSTTFQWANDPLLSAEQFSIGGARTVRGYRENQLVRDIGLVSSIELHIPLLTSKNGTVLLKAAPFFDYGIGWNVRSATPDPTDVASAGLGLIATPHRRVLGRLFWGHPFRDVNNPGDDLQDHGLHFSIAFSLW